VTRQAVAFDIGDDVPGPIDAACELGIHGIVHVSTPDSIAAVEALLGRR
jgi:hypothetical protein